MNPSGSFKDNGMTAAFTHARMVGARRAACASTGNTSRRAGRLLLGDRPRLPGDHLHRLGQDRLRQAGPGARLRRPDGPDRRRLRRRDAAGPAGGRPPRHLPGEQRQPVPPRRAEDDHVPRAGGASAGSRPTGSSCPAATSATRRAFGKAFIELKELGLIDRVPRLAVINAAGARTRSTSCTTSTACAGTTASPTWRSTGRYYDRLDAREPARPRRSPPPSRSTGR